MGHIVGHYLRALRPQRASSSSIPSTKQLFFATLTTYINTMVGKAAKITKQVLEDHFHLPMAEVAKKYGVCITYFKKVCRSHGVQRWPYRQMRSSIRKGTDDESSEKEGPQDSDSDYYSSSQGSPRYGSSCERDGADGKSDCRRSAQDGLQDESSRAPSDTSNTNAMDVLAMLCVKEKTPPPARSAPTPPPE